MNADATKPGKEGFPWLGLFVTLFGIPIVVFLLVALSGGKSAPSRGAIAWKNVHDIRGALQSYIEEFGVAPIGDNVEIMAALAGKNPNQTVFFKEFYGRFSERGEYIDPWKHPYRIDGSNPEFVWVYSFGKNGIDEGGAEGSDDVASWR